MDGHIYRDLIEQAPFAFACHQTVRNSNGDIVDFILTDVNAAFETQTKKSKADTLGRKLSALLRQEYLDAFDWIGYFSDIIRMAKTEEIAVALPTKNLSVSLKACAAEDDSLITYFTVSKNRSVTTENAEQIRNVLAASPAGMVLCDGNWILIDTNSASASLFGMDGERMLGRALSELICEEDEEEFQRFQENFSAHNFSEAILTESLGKSAVHFCATKLEENLILIHVGNPEQSAASDQRYGADSFTDLYVVSLDASYQYLYVNPAFIQAMRESGKAYASVGENFLPMITDNTLKKELMKDIAHTMRGNSHTEYHSAPWSPTLLCEYSFHPAVAESGQIVGATFYIRALGDISFDEQSQDDLSESESSRLMQTFFSELKKGAAVFSVDGKGAHASDYILRNFNAFGKQAPPSKYNKLLGKRLSELMPYAEDTAILPALKSVWLNDRSAYLPPTVYHTNETSHFLETNLFKVSTGDIILMFRNFDRKESGYDQTDTGQLAMIAENVTEVIWLVDTRMNITYISPSVERLFGLNPETLLGKSLLEHMSEGAFLQIKLELTKAISQVYTPYGNSDSFSAECEIKNAKGIAVSAEYSARMFRDGNNNVIGVIGTIRELSQIKRLERSLRRNEETMRLLLNSTAESIFGIDNNRCITFINSMCLRMLGFSEQEDLSGRNIYDNIRLYKANGTPYAPEEYPINKVFSGDYIHIEKDICVFGDRGFVPIEYYAYPQFCDDKVIGAVVTFFDISDRRKQEEDIRYLNFHDVSTNLYNRNYMDRSLNMLDQNYNLPLSYLMADINGLKNVNEEFGFGQGDKQIRDTAKILSGCVRKDDILARIGGDEFALLMPKTDNLTANELMEQIYRNVEEYNDALADAMLRITLSIGLSTKNYTFESMHTVIQEAENHMQQRKLLEDKSQKNTILTSMKTTLFERSQETELHAERLVQLSQALAKKMHLTQSQCNELELLAMLHDIGKISIDDNIINKPGKLSDQEWEAIKKHPEAGYRIAMATPELQPIANYILRHHERWDGKGYPGGLSGNEIPLLSRIISVVDAYDAMTQDRVYRKALPVGTAVEEIMRNAGTQFDPEISRMFVEVVHEVECG
ncbi:MAG: HD domain-containing phosphohydrolase [Anaerofustis sp.]